MLRARFEEALGRIKDRGCVPVVCGILPRRKVGDGWLSRAIAVNLWLEDYCKRRGWSFIDNWDRFLGKSTPYVWDGVHLSGRGVRVLSDLLEAEVSRTPGFCRAGQGEGRQ